MAGIEAGSFFGQFTDIDNAKDPEALLDGLRGVGDVPSIRAAKQRSFALLAPRDGDVLLDVGCGTGDDVRALAGLVAPRGQSIGIDSSERAVARATELARAEGTAGVRFERGEGERLPFPDGTFDGCRADRTVQHLSDPEQGLKELFRVLRPGGRLVVSECVLPWEIDDENLRRSFDALVAHNSTSREKRSWVGYLLPLIVPRAGFSQSEVEFNDEVTGDFELIRRIYPFDSLLARAVESGELSEAEATGLGEALRRAADDGRFSIRTITVHVSGRKPDTGRAFSG